MNRYFTGQKTNADDQVVGTVESDDRLAGGAGNDQLLGRDGSDTYVFQAGDGKDTVIDAGYSGTDVVEIHGHALADAQFRRVEQGSADVEVTFKNSSDKITIINALDSAYANGSIEQYVFADQSATLTRADITQLLVLGEATSGNDLVFGTASADTLTGGKGSDVLDGRGGDDIYIYARGDGDDRIEDAGSSGDVLQISGYTPDDIVSMYRSPPNGLDLVMTFRDGGDRLIVRNTLEADDNGVESIVFGNGATWSKAQIRSALIASSTTTGDDTIYGFSTDDVLQGGHGNDILHGGAGSDTYRFAAGDGADTIRDAGGGTADIVDVLDYASTDASVRRIYKGDDGIVLSFTGGNGDAITIENTLGANVDDAIEGVHFADGVTWSMADVLARLDNKAPVARDDSYFVALQDRDTVLTAATLLRNDYDPDGQPLHITSVGNASNGTVHLDPSGNVVFHANAGFTGVTSFSYTVADPVNGLHTANVYMRVRPPASATDDAGLTVAEDTALPIRVERLLANDTDGDLMTIGQVFDATHGTVSLSTGGDVIFTPDADFIGEATFKYNASTPQGGQAEATVRIQVTAVNDAPVATGEFGLATNEGTTLRLAATALLANDIDVDGDRLQITSVSGDQNVSARIDAFGDIVITPVPYFFGPAQISYVVSDGKGGTATATASITVNPVQNAPETVSDSFTISEDAPLFLAAFEVLGNDIDRDGDALVITRVYAANPFSVVQLFDNQTIQFTPPANYYGLTSFYYETSDGHGGTATGRVDVQINPVNDDPTANGERFDDTTVNFLSATEDTPLVIDPANLLRNDFDIDSPSFAISTVSFATNGIVAIDGNGKIVFTPDANYWGEASFHYVISDGQGGVGDALVTLWVAPVHDAPPVAGDDHIQILEDVTTVIQIAEILGNDSDVDRDPLQILSVSAADGVSAWLNADGNLVIAPALNVNGTTAITYVVTDNADGETVGHITLDVVAVNDDPTATADTAVTSLDAPLVIRISDIVGNDFDVDTVNMVNPPLPQFFSAQNASSGSISIYDGEFIVVEQLPGTAGPVTLDYTITDGVGGFGTAQLSGTIGGVHADEILGSARRDLLIGTAGSELLSGLAGNDDLFGRAGDDVLRGGEGADLLDGGDGFDIADYSTANIGLRADLEARIGQGGHAEGDAFLAIEGISGSNYADLLYGDGGVNRLEGAGGGDILDGRGGIDMLLGGIGDDALTGGAGADTLDGGDGIDTADYSESVDPVSVSLVTGVSSGGDAQGDTLVRVENLIGSLGNDALTGDGAANRLAGGRGDDVLDGGAGDDVLAGGQGADILIGGEGLDTC